MFSLSLSVCSYGISDRHRICERRAHTIKCHVCDCTQGNRFDFTLVIRSLDLIFYCDIDRRNGSKQFVVSLRAEHFIRIENFRDGVSRCCLSSDTKHRFRSRTWARISMRVSVCVCRWECVPCTQLLGSTWFTFCLRHTETTHRDSKFSGNQSWLELVRH